MAFVSCKRPRKGASGERGQALLELVPVVSVMLLLIFGVVEGSYAIWQLEVITALSREGSNLASRNTPLATAVSTVVTDGTSGTSMNLAQNGEVIITAVKNEGGVFTITDQSASTPTGGFSAVSRIGTGVGATATIPATAATSTAIPLPAGSLPLNSTVYVTEVFQSYVPITPLGSLVQDATPQTLYDVAYF